VHPADNVAVVAADVQAGDVVRLADGSEVRAVEAIPRGSKVALSPIARGEAAIRYGEEIGRAAVDIASGEYVHTHNLARKK
jgi:altronate hydrolase